MYRLPIVLILLAGLCFGCETRQDTTQDTEGITRLLIDRRRPKPRLPILSPITGMCRWGQPVGNIDQLLVTDDRIIVVDKERAQTVFLIFDLNGNPCAEIYRLGRGPQRILPYRPCDADPGRETAIGYTRWKGKQSLVFTISKAGLSTRSRFLSGLRGWNISTKMKYYVLRMPMSGTIPLPKYARMPTGCSFLRTISSRSRPVH